MNLHRHLEPLVDSALERFAPDENVGYLIGPAFHKPPGVEGVLIIAQLALFTPSPVMGTTLAHSIAVYHPLAVDQEGIDELVRDGVESLRDEASRELTAR